MGNKNKCKNTNGPKKSVDNQLSEKEKQFKLCQVDHAVTKQKIDNCFDCITDVVYNLGKLLFLLTLGASTFALLFFFVWSIIAYLSGDVKTAPMVMTIMQALSGLVSVFVGFWALVLTIKADKKQNSTEHRLNINRSSSGKGIEGKPDSEDVNPDSI